MSDIFNQQRVELVALSRNDFLTLLRERINKHYMPSATGEVKVNSKPRYVPSIMIRNKALAGQMTTALLMMPTLYPHDTTGYYCATDLFGYPIQDGAIYALVTTIDGYQLRVNLKTDQIDVRFAPYALDKIPDFIPWGNDTDTLPIAHHEFIKTIDTYL